MNASIREKLLQMSEKGYKEFSSSLIPNAENLLGVRLPILRNLAKDIAKGNWQEILNDEATDIYFEETMLRGMIIGIANMPLDIRFEYIKSLIPKIDNWSVCDSFCASLKFTKKHKQEVLEFILPYLSSEKEFDVRFAVVMLLNFFICDEYIDNVLAELDKVNHNGYYAKMAVAWALSVCFIKFEDKTMAYLKNSSLDNFTYNKALQKIIESYRVDKETKDIVRSLKRHDQYVTTIYTF